MTKQSYVELQEQVAKQFDQLNNRKEELTKESAEIDAELVRLQGEYRAYQNLINGEVENVAGDGVEPAPALVVEAKEQVGEGDTKDANTESN